MSNLSDIGFPVSGEHDVNQVIMDILPHLEEVPCLPHGYYFRFLDESGAQIYLQTNAAKEIIGFNPAFDGESQRTVELNEDIERDTSDLDGAFRCTNKFGGEETANYPLVFDSPDFRVHSTETLPVERSVGITAFASNDLEIFDTAEEFRAKSGGELDLADKSFIPSGLYTFSEEGEPVEQEPPQAHAILTGRITECQKRRNSFTGNEFYYFVVESFGGFVDIVADPKLIQSEPKIGGVVKGSFWLSGKVLS